MKTILRHLLTTVVLFTIAGSALLFTSLGERPLSAFFSVGKFDAVEFEGLELTNKPNQFLMCPPSICKGHADSTVFKISVNKLRELWLNLVKTKPRLELLAENGQQFDYVQRSERFRFPDIITVRFIRVSPSEATLAIYSRSVYGQSDFGVNRKRIEAWLSEIREKYESVVDEDS